MSSKKLQREAAAPGLPSTGKFSGMTRARLKSDTARRCEPGEPTTMVTPDPWYLGYATALAQIWRLHHDGQLVRHVLAAGGLTFKHLELGGVEGRDLAAIRDACLGTRSEASLALVASPLILERP